jgi:hypothetical protein
LDLLPSPATRLRQHYLDFGAKYLPPQYVAPAADTVGVDPPSLPTRMS